MGSAVKGWNLKSGADYGTLESEQVSKLLKWYLGVSDLFLWAVAGVLKLESLRFGSTLRWGRSCLRFGHLRLML